MSQEPRPYYPGLDGVLAGETAISTIEGGLQYYGYAVRDLAEDATFEEVAHLLLRGRLPSEEELADFEAILVEASMVPDEVINFMSTIPLHVNEMDVLRTTVSALAHWDEDPSGTSNVTKAERLLGQIPILIAARYRQRMGLRVLQPQPDLSVAANLLYLITGDEPSPTQERAMDVSLILYAEHEFNASTFTARVVTSTLSDLHSAVVAAIGALKGPLHGGANEQVLRQLQEIGSPNNAEAWFRDMVGDKRRLMGFGHRVYKEGDPRAYVLKDYCVRLAEERGQMELERTAEIIERLARDTKGLYPNLDWPSARLYHYLGLDVDLFTPLFVASRVSGWCAHIIEQSQHNRLIRPRARYIGQTGLTFEPLSERESAE
ncbi:MAG: 2-methylcitrate synthase/citrate synthase [Planctomycetaceae bacterium]|nr:2-methylcitrate synthase/citrate synthase [Planctomycetaceae bacterium]